jgi:hypothetical protein
VEREVLTGAIRAQKVSIERDQEEYSWICHGYRVGAVGAKTKFRFLGEKEKNDENTFEVNRRWGVVVLAVASQLVSPGELAV